MATGAKLNWATVVLGLAAASTAILVELYAGRSSLSGLASIVWHLIVAAWVASPYFFPCTAPIVFAGERNHRIARDVVLLLGTAVIGGLGSFIYIDAFVIHLDAENGIVFLFLLFWQWIGVAVTFAVALCGDLLSRRLQR